VRGGIGLANLPVDAAPGPRKGGILGWWPAPLDFALPLPAMEFANLTLVFLTAWLVWKKPARERTAFALLVTSVLLAAFLFFLATRTSILPPVNY
jgi:hypothetical protein